MLHTLSIKNFVLIEQLDLTFDQGLTILTGETGAGKSILLDALDLILGQRSRTFLIRPGKEQASVSACFRTESTPSIQEILEEQGIEAGDELIIRRIITQDGRSKAFLNDEPVSVNLLKRLGKQLVEIHGQFDHLLEVKSHRTILDTYGGLVAHVNTVAEQYEGWKATLEKFTTAKEGQAKLIEDREYIRASLDELEGLSPQVGEEDELSQERELLANQSKIQEGIQGALGCMHGEQGIENQINQAYRAVEKSHGFAPDALQESLACFDRLSNEASEAMNSLQAVQAKLPNDPFRLEAIEDRLFKLRSAARKHHCITDELVVAQESLQEKYDLIDGGDEKLRELEAAATKAKESYFNAAKTLSDERQQIASQLEQAVAQELPALKLGEAHFKTNIQQLEEEHWSVHGIDRIAFQIQTNAGMPWGLLTDVASGGERSRLMLAVKVVLAQKGYIPTLIFDEIDSGTGGAIASAIGDRLARLGKELQVLTVTHAPQVACHANAHLRVEKSKVEGQTQTNVVTLSTQDQREELARMLAGESITDEARAAAEQLLKKAS